MTINPNEVDLSKLTPDELAAIELEAEALGKKHIDALNNQKRRQNVQV